MGRVRNWIETRFSRMVRSFWCTEPAPFRRGSSTGLHRIESRSFWGFLSRVSLIILAHHLIRSRLLLKMAGVEVLAMR